MITTVIFDWAGTTIDFGSVAPVSAFREAFRQYGIEVSEEETRAPMGMLKIDHIRTMLAAPELAARFEAAKGRRPDESDAQAIYASFEPAQMAVLTQHCDLKPGLIGCVKALRAKGIRIGTTTGFTREMMSVVAPEAIVAYTFAARALAAPLEACPSTKPSSSLEYIFSASVNSSMICM